MHAFYTGELYSRRVSIKLLSYYILLENILVEGKAGNKQRKVNERKSNIPMIVTCLAYFSIYNL